MSQRGLAGVARPDPRPTLSVLMTILAAVSGAVVGLSAAANDGGPYAEAGLDQSVDQDATVYLDAGGSVDPDGRVTEYRWRAEAPDGSRASVDCPTCERTHFRARQAGEYVISVTVTGSDGATATDTMYVEVSATANGCEESCRPELPPELRASSFTSLSDAGGTLPGVSGAYRTSSGDIQLVNSNGNFGVAGQKINGHSLVQAAGGYNNVGDNTITTLGEAQSAGLVSNSEAVDIQQKVSSNNGYAKESSGSEGGCSSLGCAAAAFAKQQQIEEKAKEISDYPNDWLKKLVKHPQAGDVPDGAAERVLEDRGASPHKIDEPDECDKGESFRTEGACTSPLAGLPAGILG